MDIFGGNFQVLEKALNLRMTQNRVIAANIANVDTAGFQAHRMDFEASMQKALQAAESAGDGPATLEHLESAFNGSDADAVIEPTNDASSGLDGNNVNMDGELAAMTRNSMMYQVTARLLAAKYGQIRAVLESER